MSLTITSETWNGEVWAIAGAFEWKCLFGAECSGFEQVDGTLTPSGEIELVGFNLIDPENIGLRSYTGQRSANGLTITGTFPGGTWTVSRVSAFAVPAEVATIQSAVDQFWDRPALRVELAPGTHGSQLRGDRSDKRQGKNHCR